MKRFAILALLLATLIAHGKVVVVVDGSLRGSCFVDCPTPPPEPEPGELTYATGAYTDWTSNFTIGDATVVDPAVEDGIAAGNTFYVCDTGGNDANDGLLTSRGGDGPWSSINKVEGETFGPGDYVLFCRDGEWAGTMTIESAANGAEDNHAVFGAYGAVSGDPPFIEQTDWSNNSYVTVRDIDTRRFGTDGNDGATPYFQHNFIVFNNIVRGNANTGNCIMFNGVTEFIVIARNLVYDCLNNDGLGIHADNFNGTDWFGAIGKFWAIDNIVAGHSGMEDCFDVTGVSDSDLVSDNAKDMKVVLNKCMGADVPGLSALTGHLFACVQNNHQNQYVWIMWNYCGGELRQRAYVGNSGGIDDKHGYFAANLFISETLGVSGETLGNSYSEGTMTIEHVTHIHQISIREIAQWDGTNYNFNDNIVWFAHDDHNYGCFSGTASFDSVDRNHYHSNNAPNDTCDLASARTFTGDDTNSTEGAMPGISLPNWTTWADPRDWDDQAYRDHFIPDAGWSRSAGADTPGMFDENGNLTITTMPTISGAANGGCGWDGGDIVADILDRHGVNPCVP